MVTLLYLDIDTRNVPPLVSRITQCCRLWGWPIEAIRYDRTAHGWHVVVGVRKQIPPPLVVAAQAIFGSDRNREMFNLMRVQQLSKMPAFWRRRWNVIYSSHTHNITVKNRDTCS